MFKALFLSLIFQITSFVFSVAEFKRELSKESILVDVRTKEEFEQGHITNAINIPVDSVGFETAITKFPKNKTILLYCHSGRRSSKAAKEMQILGFVKTIELEGGYISWKKAEINFQ
ncbi:rhodanese-like domain-containing protein [Flavobacteriaceae bacterium]|nr:rhodanese-like domain-containing protein [Flavobacteriaceae bacterium]